MLYYKIDAGVIILRVAEDVLVEVWDTVKP